MYVKVTLTNFNEALKDKHGGQHGGQHGGC